MHMVRKIAELRATTDDVLIAEHDAAAENTYVGTGYYMDELTRRAFERVAEESQRLAVRGLWLAISNLVVSVIAIVIAVLAIVLN